MENEFVLGYCFFAVSIFCDSTEFHNSVNCNRPGECSPEKDCLR